MIPLTVPSLVVTTPHVCDGVGMLYKKNNGIPLFIQPVGLKNFRKRLIITHLGLKLEVFWIGLFLARFQLHYQLTTTN